MNPMLPDFTGSKVNICTENVYRIWNETKIDRLTQLCFCDMSTPNPKNTIPMKENKNGDYVHDWDYEGFTTVYEDLMKKLLKKVYPKTK